MLHRVQLRKLRNKWRYGIFGILVAFAGVACATAVPSAPVTPPSSASLPSITPTQPLPTAPVREQSPVVQIEPTASLLEPMPTSQPTSTAVPPTAAAEPEEVVSLDREVDELEESPLALFKALNPDGPKEVDTRFFDQLLSPDAIEPIYRPQIGDPDDVELDLDDLIMGVSVNGESRAYPIRVLRFREIVNDEVGGVPILVTW